jgi:predicted aspartyl protease
VAAYIHGRRLVALVDTGAQHSSIFLTTALSLGVTAEDLKGDRAFKVQGIGIGQVGAMMHVFPALTVGDLTLRNTKLLVIADRSHDDTEIILGADFQHRLHLWISNSGKSLIMQYPPMPSPAVPAGWLATSHQRK